MKNSSLVLILILVIIITGECSSCKRKATFAPNEANPSSTIDNPNVIVTDIPSIIITPSPTVSPYIKESEAPSVTLAISSNDEEIVISENDYEYRNEKYAYTFLVPTVWDGKYKVIENDNTTSFEYSGEKFSDGSYQLFFTIEVLSDDEYNELKKDPEMPGELLGQETGNNYILWTPIDMAIMDQVKAEEYISLNLSINQIKERFRLN